MSGYANDEVLHDSAAHGFDAVLKKPFDLMALRDTLERLLKK
jgi:CheY-like chemotaxis protein